MKKLALLITVILPMFIFAQNVELKDQTKKVYNEGLELRKQGNFKGSVAKFDEALKLENSYIIHFQKGVSLLKENNYSSALSSFETSLKMKGDFDQALFYAGTASFSLKDFEKAADYFKKAKEKTKNLQIKKSAESNLEKIDEQKIYPLLQAGQTALANKNFNEAVKQFTEVVKTHQNESAYMGLADAYNELGQYEKALENAGKALTYRKTIPEGGIYYIIASSYKNMGKNDLALQNFEKCMNDKSAKNKGYRDRAEHEMKTLK